MILMNSISPAELKKLLSDDPRAIDLVDVREQSEHDAFHIGGRLIPFMDIIDNHEMIPRNKPVILYCSKGIRSFLAIQRLEEKYNFTNLYNLSGGIDAWIKEFGNK